MSFGNNQRNKVVLIDGSNLFASAQAIHLDLDYIKLRNVFGKNALHVIYYTALPAEGENIKLRPLLDKLQFNGFLLVTKTWKRFFNAETNVHTVKGNMDIEIAVDAMNLSSHVKDMVFFTGDGDFAPLIRDLQSKGVHCTVVSTLCLKHKNFEGKPQHPMIADELRKQCNVFIDLDDVRDKIKRDDDAYQKTPEVPLRPTLYHKKRADV